MPWGLIDGSRCLSIGVGIQVCLPEANIDEQDWCPDWMAGHSGSLGLPTALPGTGGGILKAADPDARMEVEGGAEDL